MGTLESSFAEQAQEHAIAWFDRIDALVAGADAETLRQLLFLLDPTPGRPWGDASFTALYEAELIGLVRAAKPWISSHADPPST